MHVKIPLRQYWKLLVSYLKPQWPTATLLATLMGIQIGLRLANPQILRAFIDSALSGGEIAGLLNAALAYLGIGFANQVLAVLITYVSESVAWTATNALRLDLTRHCLKLDQSFHKAHAPGELIERIDGDVNTLANFFSRFVIGILGNTVLLLGILVLVYREDLRMGLGLSLFAAFALFGLIRLRALATPHWTLVRKQMADFYGFLGERLAGTEDIRANGAQGYVMRRFYELTRERLPAQMKAGLAGYAMWMMNETLYGLADAMAFALGAYLWGAGAMTIGTIYLIAHYTAAMVGPISSIRGQLVDLQQAAAGIGRIRELLNTTSRLHEGAEGQMPPGALQVSLRDLSFGYGEGETVLQGVTFELRPGRVLGLLGRTGSGKTTLARLLLRLYDPSSGEVRLGGVAPSAVRLSEVRRRVSLVTQDVQLFQATVRDNLTFFNPAIPDERIAAALRDLGLGEWLHSLSDGLDTKLQAGGGGLSAGQAQLLAFARVFLADPGLVILDEASSRLDPASERLVERAVDKLLAGRTGILIAHRLATVHRADEILILEEGQVLEHGERARLAGDPDSHFYHLLRTGLEEVLA